MPPMNYEPRQPTSTTRIVLSLSTVHLMRRRQDPCLTSGRRPSSRRCHRHCVEGGRRPVAVGSAHPVVVQVSIRRVRLAGHPAAADGRLVVASGRLASHRQAPALDGRLYRVAWAGWVQAALLQARSNLLDNTCIYDDAESSVGGSELPTPIQRHRGSRLADPASSSGAAGEPRRGAPHNQ